MKKDIFNIIIANPKKNLTNTCRDEIDLLKTKFPYCELIHNISLIQASHEGDINFNEILSLSSLYSTNREKLFTILNPRTTTKSSKKSVKKYNFKEWLHKPDTNKTQSIPKKTLPNRLKYSITDNDHLTTETLAELYAEQGHYERAIQAYSILCLKYPKKSSLFANRIKDIQTKIN